MNKDKAIQLLERLQDPEPYEPMLTKDAYDAIQMAIDALSADGDTISRKAAIDALGELATFTDECGEHTWMYTDDVYKAIKKLPPAQPEPHWIPVEQDTPTEDDDYWCTFGAETGWFVDWCSWYHGRWVVWLNDIPNEVSNVIAWCKPMKPYKGVTE